MEPSMRSIPSTDRPPSLQMPKASDSAPSTVRYTPPTRREKLKGRGRKHHLPERSHTRLRRSKVTSFMSRTIELQSG